MNSGSVNDTSQINPGSDAAAAAAAGFAMPPFPAAPPYGYGFPACAMPTWGYAWPPGAAFVPSAAAAAAPPPDAAAPAGGMAKLMQDLAGGNGSGLSGLTQLLSLDDKEFWKGALVGAAAVLLLTNEGVQRALFRGAVKSRDAVQGGVKKVRERTGTARPARKRASKSAQTTED